MANRNYYLMLDTETFGGFKSPIVYDIGMAIVDKKGKVYAKYSFVIEETFYTEEAVTTAYYKDKFPMYQQEIEMGKRKVVSWECAIWIANKLCEKYHVKAIVAHNAKFDFISCNNTTQYLGYGNIFIRKNIPWWDTQQMAADTIAKQKMYRAFCEKYGYITKSGRVRLTAEILYRYISGKRDFIENHTGLEDVLIEKEIFVKCIAQHKKMRTTFFNFSY